jgi:ribonuclease BN (tRNA processing enzyme)
MVIKYIWDIVNFCLLGEIYVKLTVLGARGSLPVGGAEYDYYGGETSCYMVEAGGNVIFLDAGTGMFKAPKVEADADITILLTHTHLDHLIGLPFLGEMAGKERKITMYSKAPGKASTEELLRGIFEKSYWPVTPWEFPASFECIDTEFPLELGQVVVDAINLPHPGGCLGFKISIGDKSIVHLTDCELNEGVMDRLAAFAKGTDLLLCDAQYASKEYETHRGYGHSSIDTALLLKEKSGCKKMLLVHHDPYNTDKKLNEIEKSIRDDNVMLARSGMEICI